MKSSHYKNIIHLINRIIHVGLVFIPLFTLSSCFTGIESTKKINLSREDKRLAKPSREDRFMEQVQPETLKDWEEGKRFIVTDNRALYVMVPQEGLRPYAPDSIKGEILVYKGVESKMSPSGDINLALLFSDGIYTYAYDTGKEFKKALEEMKSDRIPMLIDEDMVTQARSLLTGEKFWSRTNLWYDKSGNRIPGKKYEEVTIVDVQPGDMVFPLRLQIKTPEDETAYLFMNFGTGDTESRSFHNLFSFTDIKKHYPSILPETWKKISRGEVTIGMTKDECRLSLGNPDEVSSGHDYSQTLDIWTFESGKVLWFEDGRLVKMR